MYPSGLLCEVLERTGNIQVVNTVHADDRLHERFSELDIPEKRIRLAGRRKKEGQVFIVKTFLAKYVCQRERGYIKIVTIYYS